MTNLEPIHQFIEPSPKPELGGELGLYASEIAESLGVEASKVRRKLAEQGFLNRLNQLNMAALPFRLLNQNNGLEFTEYALSVDATKFLIGRWNNRVGDAYLAFLVKLHGKVDDLEMQAKEDPLTASMLANIKLRQEQIRQGKALREVQGKVEKLPEMVKENVNRAIDSKHQFPSECIRSEHIGAKYFPKVARNKYMAFLAAINHPRGSFIHSDERGSAVSHPFIEKGLHEASARFFRERSHVKTTPKMIYWHHPLVGDFQERKGDQ